jgi:hypothetical protein
LESITLPTGVTRIWATAFVGSTSLESVVIPASVTRIGERAFYGSNLKAVCFQGRPPQAYEDSFAYADPELVLYYPTNFMSLWAPNGEKTWNGYKIAPWQRGNVSTSGTVKANDAALILRWIVRLEKLSDFQQFLADVDRDGKVTAADAAKILRYIVKLEPEL